MPGSITSANAILTISQAILFPTPQQMQGFAADDIFDMASVRTIETSLGVDGNLSAGFVFAERVMSIALQADSLSNTFFDIINSQQAAAKDVYPLSGTVILKSIGTKWSLVRGFLTGYKPMPDAKKTLQPRRYEVTWESVFPAQTG